MKVEENTKIGELLARHPEVAAVFYEHGFACLGCQFAAYETIGEGAGAHGMDRRKMRELIKKLNETVEKEGKRDKPVERKKKGKLSDAVEKEKKEKQSNAAERKGKEKQSKTVEMGGKGKPSNAVGKKKEVKPSNAVKRKK
ncbi:hypothetical protein COV61_04900 [Candidatus Micrarchaeota archaeon CG11_big_fil_rev_8_21_14_0_20_47_5]|nr:MAG: hypothetical protein AUJ17_00500 [Candidatus Micrarchaeota archaeon CG1_02_47_40]PIN82798.1 MAG: hypothetical protein COV61_04900 [Candidatus Micrarchaeota archaeon CG11_big_fil_rev_8_21_14_0_20_47_5]